MIFDTHAHLDDEAFDNDRDALILDLEKSVVQRVVNVAYSLNSANESVKLANRHDFIYAAVGIHPHEASSINESQITEIREMCNDKKVVAIGEIGLDYYYDFAPREIQQYWFKRQIRLAEELELPYIVHSRDAAKDTLDIIKNTRLSTQFVLHCYSQSAEMVQEYVNLGGYISFAGPITFKNASKLKEAIKAIPIDKLLIETDSPYLSPVPNRGKRNSPLNLEWIAKTCAEILGIPYQELCDITCQNSNRFFNL